MKEITFASYEEYFRNISRNFSVIKGFYTIDMFEFSTFLSDLRGKKFQTPLLLLEAYNLGTLAYSLDNVIDVYDGAIVIIDEYDPRNFTSDKKTETLVKLDYMAKQIRAKMLIDCKQMEYLMRGLEPESMELSPTEIIASTFKGIRMQFTINCANDISLSNDWFK